MINITQKTIHRIISVAKLPFLLLACGAFSTAYAVDYTWISQSSLGWAVAANWTSTGGASAPITSSDKAIFGPGANLQHSIFNSDTFTVGGIQYNAGAATYTITNQGNMSISALGLINNSGVVQQIINSGQMIFQGSTISGTSTTTIQTSNLLRFQGAGSNAGNSTINVTNGELSFNNGGNAGSSTINNTRGALKFYVGGHAGSSTITSSDIGHVVFQDTSTGEGSTIINNSINPVGVDLSLMTQALTIGSLSGTGNVLLGSHALALGALNKTDTISGVISGAGGLTKVGTGTLILAGDNTYSGGTTISDGRLQIGNGGTTGSVLGNIVNNSVLAFDRADTVTYSDVISGTGALNQIGTGTLTLTGVNTYTGATTINSGSALAIGAGGNLASATTVANAGTFNISGMSSNLTIGALSGAGNTILGNNSLIVGGANNSTAVSGVISGAGGLTKVGTGLLTLTGENTYAGGTTISAGGLIIGNSGTTGSIVGNITNNGTLQFNRSDTVTYDGVISGSGNVLQAGGGQGGTLILTGNNTYTGGTKITGGTPGGRANILQIGNGGTTGSISGNVSADFNSVLAFNRSDTLTYDGVIEGLGALNQLGTGTTILTGNNDYLGGTTISAGTLQIGNGGTTGSITGNVLNNGILAFDRADTVTYTDAISGTGGLNQLGVGTLILTGNKTYTGDTTVSAGTLQIGNTGLGGSVAGNILNDATLAFMGTATANANAITNNGMLNISELETAGISVGSLSGAGTVSLGDRNLSVGDLNTNTTVSGVISGAGGQLTKVGTGTLTLDGTNTYTGLTTVEAGTLLVGGKNPAVASLAAPSIAGDATVATGATLGGYFGTIGGNIINNGIVTPTSISTLTVNGNFTQNTSGNYDINVSHDGASDLLAIGGTAALSGGVAIDALDQGFLPGHAYTILSAGGGITGTFENVHFGEVFDPAFVTSQLLYVGNVVQVIIDFNEAAIELAAQTPNQQAVANYILATGGTAAVEYLVSTLTTNQQFQNAMDQISGATYANQSLALAHIGGLFSNQIGNRLNTSSDYCTDIDGDTVRRNGQQTAYAESCQNNKTIWMNLQTGNDQIASSSDVSGLNSTYNTLMMGFEFPLAESTTLGAGFAYNDFQGNATGGVEIANYSGQLLQLGLYGKHEMGPWLFGASADAGMTTNMQTQRQIQSGSGALVGTQADQNVNLFAQQLRASYDLAPGSDYTLQPFAGFISQQVNMGNFNEQGGTGFELNVDSSTYFSARSQLGFKAEAPVFAMLKPFASLSWEHEFANQQANFDGSLTGLNNLSGANTTFYISSADVGRESALVNAGITFLAQKNWDLALVYEGRFASGWQANAASLQVDVALF